MMLYDIKDNLSFNYEGVIRNVRGSIVRVVGIFEDVT